MISFKTYAISLIVIGILGFAVGKFTNRGIESTTAVVKDQDVAKDTKKITVVITAPDGDKTTTETTEVDTHVSTETKKSVDTVVKPVEPKVNFSALGGADVTKRFQPLYGISVSKEVLGPFTVGAWGLTNGTYGISIGVNF